ncbi:hypothetical protein DRO26_00710, partial [Candidatus Bathyarchaeota archaeon]
NKNHREKILGKIRVLALRLREVKLKPSILVFCCSLGLYRDESFKTLSSFPSNVGFVKVPCLSRLDVIHILEAFRLGVDIILVVGCENDVCKHKDGSLRFEESVKKLKKQLKEIGFADWKLNIALVKENFVEKIRNLVEDLSKTSIKS